MTEFRNESGLRFTDISSEQWREYTFPGGQTAHIEAPMWLHISENGHRLLDAAGVSHYVPRTWVHLKRLAKDGEPQFVA